MSHSPDCSVSSLPPPALSPPFPVLLSLLSPYSTGVVWECVLVGKDLEKFGMCGSRVFSVLKFTDLRRLSLSRFVTLKSIVNDFKNPKRLTKFFPWQGLGFPIPKEFLSPSHYL